METELKLGDRLSELMFYKNIKNETLAKEIHVNVTTIGRWKRNDKYIRLSHLLSLAVYFECSLEFLTGRSDVILGFTPQECPPFYEHLKKLLDANGISQNKVNRDTRIKSSHFFDWSRGSDPHILSLIELADYLNVTLDELVGREN